MATCQPIVAGTASTLWFTLPAGALVLLLSFFAGGFLYLGASDLLPEAHEKDPSLAALTATLGGFLFVLIVIRLLDFGTAP